MRRVMISDALKEKCALPMDQLIRNARKWQEFFFLLLLLLFLFCHWRSTLSPNQFGDNCHLLKDTFTESICFKAASKIEYFHFASVFVVVVVLHKFTFDSFLLDAVREYGNRTNANFEATILDCDPESVCLISFLINCAIGKYTKINQKLERQTQRTRQLLVRQAQKH